MTRHWKIGVLVGVILLAVLAVVVGTGWYLSDVLKEGGLVSDREDPKLDLEVAAVGDGSVTLIWTPETDEHGDWRARGLWGLEGESTYDQAGAIRKITGRSVVREFLPMDGDLKLGDRVRLDSYAFPGDPQEAHGLSFEEVVTPCGLGDCPAWLVGGSSNVWVIFVHGRRADRKEALRILPAIAELGFTTLVITYRNDPEAPASPGGLNRYGQTEWEDLEGAVSYASKNGADGGVILVGYSMGGAIVASFLHESTLSDRVVAAILDAPMLDFSATVDLGGKEEGYPMPLISLAKLFTGLRFDLDWRGLNYLQHADELAVPILLFHGDTDDVVPVETSDRLAEVRPDIVQYVRNPGVKHVRSWNADPAFYEKAVTRFLREVIDRSGS